MADLRSVTAMLETNLEQGEGTVGWGTFTLDVFVLQSLTQSSAVLPPGCG
jgi:hypothetical protein